MASSAGQLLVAGRIPGERIETTEALSDSAGFTTTEVVLMTVVAPLVAGRTYQIRATGQFGTDTSGDTVEYRIRHNDTVGAQRTQGRVELINAGVAGTPFEPLEAEFTPTASGDVTFVFTGDVIIGTGTARLEADTTRPSYLYVNYIRG